MPRAFDLIIFDWDGTLMDSAARIVSCMQAAAEASQLPIPSDEAVRDIIGLAMPQVMQRLFPQAPQLHEVFFAHYRRQFINADQTPSPLFASIPQLLERLAAEDYLLAVATGKSRAGLQRALQGTATEQYFVTSRCADEAHSKPHPQMLLDILDQLGVEPQRALMVGDTEYDMVMAHNAGVAAVAVSYGAHDVARLHALQPRACFDDLALLPDWLSTQPINGEG